MSDPTEPLRRTYSREEAIAAARAWMVETYGEPREAEDRGEWHARFGALVDCLCGMFPAEEGDATATERRVARKGG